MNAHDDVIAVGDPLPTIAAVEPAEGLSVRVTWDDGILDLVDLSAPIAAFKVLRPLRGNPALFQRVAVGYLGGSLSWGGDLEIGADTVEHLALTQRPMPADAFKSFLKRHRMTLDVAADALGISRRQAAYFASGDKPIPRTVALACRGYDADRHRPGASRAGSVSA